MIALYSLALLVSAALLLGARADGGEVRASVARLRAGGLGPWRSSAFTAIGNFCEHVFVSTKGGSYARFRRALETGNLMLIRAAAAELPRVNLDDALRVCLLLRSADAALYERSAIRWLGRFALEHPGTTLAMLHQAIAAFGRLPDDPEASRRELVALIRS